MKNFKENPVEEENKEETRGVNAEVLIIRSSIQDTITLIISIVVILVLLATLSIIPPREHLVYILRFLPLFTLLDCDVRAIIDAIKMQYWGILIGYFGILIMIIATAVHYIMT